MRILHLCLSNFYVDEAGYQENHLVRQHVDDGHEVLVIASTETFDGKGGLEYREPESYLGSDGARVIRLSYTRWLPHKMARKLRIHHGVYALINDFKPDAILFHGCAGNEIVTAASYASDNPDVLLYADSHEDFNNSARGFVSKNILHRLYYRNRIQRALPQIRKILCVNVEAMKFVSELYGVPEDRLEFFPLGGKVLESADISSRRARTRAQHRLSDDVFVFVQSGKMTVRKKLADSLDAFSRLDPVIIDDVPGHQPYISAGATLVRNKSSLIDAMQDALHWDRDEKRTKAMHFAKATLDYKKLATRILKA